MSDDISSRLGRIEGKLDLMLISQKDHGDRISIIEKFKERVTAYILAASAAFGALWQFVPKVFSNIGGS